MTQQNLIILIFTLLICNQSPAQTNRLFFDLTGGGGRLFPHSKMQNLAGPVTFFNAKLGLKTQGEAEWQRVYHYPQIGIGLSRNHLSTKSLGSATAVYSFMNLPLYAESAFNLNLGIHLGLAWGFNPDRDQHPEDVVIGSKLAVYSTLNINSAFRISPCIELLVAAEAYHLSNGNTNKPNKGINMLGAETGLRYMFSGSAATPNVSPVAPLRKHSCIILLGAWGWMKESTSYASKCSVGSLSAGYYRTVNHKSRLSAGIDLFYDEGPLYVSPKDNQLENLVAAGLFGGHELTFNQLSIVTQLGLYLRNPSAGDPFYYERIGLRYTIVKRIIPSFTVKTHGVDVDFIEWGVGFILWKS